LLQILASILRNRMQQQQAQRPATG
jgi:hypothetical protein